VPLADSTRLPRLTTEVSKVGLAAVCAGRYANL
jgi:hypothetical protein